MLVHSFLLAIAGFATVSGVPVKSALDLTRVRAQSQAARAAWLEDNRPEDNARAGLNFVPSDVPGFSQLAAFDQCNTAYPSFLTSAGECVYQPSRSRKTWLKAQEDCVTRGGGLALIKTRVDLDNVDKYYWAYEQTGNYPWVGGVQASAYEFADTRGGRKSLRAAGWLWVDGSGIVPEALWAPNGNQPDDAGGAESCLDVFINKGLNDAPCGRVDHYLCGFKP